MRKSIQVFFITLSCFISMFFSFFTAGAADEFVISKDGTARAEIVLLPNSGPMAEEAVRDLRRVIGAMGGGTLERKDAVGKNPAIVIGTAGDWAKLTKDEAPSSRLKDSSPESFILLSKASQLLILGKDARGASHGVYTLLRDLGCRWYFIADEWEVIPRMKDITVKVDKAEGPAMRVRKLNCGMSQGGASARLFEDWARRNRMGSAYGQRGISHAYANYVPESLFKEHPEYFALVSPDGDKPGSKQNGLQPCTTRPEVVKLFIEGALDILRKRKADDPSNSLLLSVSPNDNTGNMCRCENCRKVGSYTDCALLLANQVAEGIHGEFPDTLVGFMAYGRVSPAPSPGKTAHPNVMVSMATAYTWRTSPLEMLKEWPKFVKHLIIREYYCISQWGGSDPDYEGPDVSDISRTIKQWHQQGIEGVESEMNHSWGSCGLRFWSSAEFMWNPDATAEGVKNDFYTRCWGEAADPMRRYYERWESGQVASDRTIGLSFMDLSEAARLAKDPGILQRINLLTLYLHWFHLKRETERIADECKLLKLGDEEIQERMGALCEEGNNLLYRSKDSYLLPVQPRAYKMTRTSSPFSAVEVDEIRKKDISFYQKRLGSISEIGGAAYSNDLVPLSEFKDIKSLEPCETVEGRFGSISYVIRAKAGEEIKMSFEFPAPKAVAVEKAKDSKAADPADVQDDTDDNPAVQKLDRAGRVEIWYLGNDGKEQIFIDLQNIFPDTQNSAYKVTKDGLYMVDVKVPRGKYLGAKILDRPYSIIADIRHQKNVFPLSQIPKAESGGLKPSSLFYFYVPSGTKCFAVQLQRLKSTRPIDLKISTLSGQVIKEENGTKETDWIVQVPPEKAGGIWKIWFNIDSYFRLGFEGIPPYVASHPGNLLVPREQTGVKEKR